MKRAFPRYDQAGVARARGLRERMTPGEVRLWQRLRGRRLGVVFKRQQPIGAFVVDFYCPALRLVVEIDGWSHGEKGKADLARQAFLEAQGLHVLRFEESDVCRDPEHAVRQIADWIRATRNEPPPSGEVAPLEAGPEGVDPRGPESLSSD